MHQVEPRKPGSGLPARCWHYLQIRMPRDSADFADLRRQGDDIVVRLLGLRPTTEPTGPEGVPCFFIRYGDPDYHVRVRVHCSEARFESWAAARSARFAEHFGAQALQWTPPYAGNPFVTVAGYEPEHGKYGPPRAMGVAEQAFCLLSGVAAELLALEQSGGPGRGHSALDTLKMLLQRLPLSGAEQAYMLRSQCSYWISGPMERSPAFRKLDAANADAIVHLRSAHHAAPGRIARNLPDGWADALTSRWEGAIAAFLAAERDGAAPGKVRRYFAGVRDELPRGGLQTSPVTCLHWVPNLVHLFLNMLGIEIHREVQLLSLLCALLEGDAASEAHVGLVLDPTRLDLGASTCK